VAKRVIRSVTQRRTDNTVAKRVIIVCSSLSYTPYYSFGHCIVCSSLSYCSLLLFWSLHCLFFFELLLLITLLATVLSVLLLLATVLSFLLLDNTVAKRVIRSCNSKKNRQYSGQRSNKELSLKEEQTIQWPKE
jgi:hypothetical protein